MATVQINFKGSRRTKFCQDYCWVEEGFDVMNITCKIRMKEVPVSELFMDMSNILISKYLR